MKDVIDLIKRYLKLTKDLSMLLDGDSSFIKCYNKDTHRLHGRVDSLGTATGRMTHNSPNITQFPRDKLFRELLTVPDNKVLIDVDASALELMMLGHYLAPYDNHKFMHAVSKGDKKNDTDIHTLNQKAMGLPTRDSAKTAIYAINYGAGATKIGDMLWDKSPFEYSNEEYLKAVDSLNKRIVFIDKKKFFPINKDTLTPFNEELILATIYGNRVLTRFRDNTKGYNELANWAINSIKDNKIKALDRRLLFVRSPHKVLNLYLQSAGAIFMKYLLVNIADKLNAKYKYRSQYAFVANIHDAINIECDSDIASDICDILRQTFMDTSYQLGLKYPIEGEPKIGKNQYETH